MENKSKTNEKLAHEICRYLTEHMESRITIQMLSERFHVSGTGIKCAFKSVYGESVYAYIRKQKMLSPQKSLKQPIKACLKLQAATAMITVLNLPRHFATVWVCLRLHIEKTGNLSKWSGKCNSVNI